MTETENKTDDQTQFADLSAETVEEIKETFSTPSTASAQITGLEIPQLEPEPTQSEEITPEIRKKERRVIRESIAADQRRGTGELVKISAAVPGRFYQVQDETGATVYAGELATVYRGELVFTERIKEFRFKDFRFFEVSREKAFEISLNLE